jgi:WhiB family redox-sensing transcriptional regulator
MPPADPTVWADRAACSEADPELFFSGEDDDQKVALLLCEGCPVREPCLRFAVLDGQMHGVWGGTLEPRRRQMIRDRRRQLREAA